MVGGDKMRIKIMANKKGSGTLLDQHFGLIKELIQRYPNALWRRYYGKNGKVEGYELDV